MSKMKQEIITFKADEALLKAMKGAGRLLSRLIKKIRV